MAGPLCRAYAWLIDFLLRLVFMFLLWIALIRNLLRAVDFLPLFYGVGLVSTVVNLMLNRLYDLQPSLLTSDYYNAALDLMRRVRKRALVVILSNLRDEDDDTLAPALRLLSRRHLVLFASLRENILSRALTARVDSFDRALTYAATADYLRSRELAFRRLERGGALCLDVEPQQLPLALVNRYLEIKREGRL